jgi:hypothetical protein
MSVHISSVVWKVVMPNAGRKLVAVALADMANDDGSCWPSLRTLSARCNLSEDSIRNHLHALEAIGILKASPRFQEGRQTSNVYCFAPDVVTGKALHLEGGRVEPAPPLENREGGRKPEGEGGKKQEGGGGEKLPPHESSYRTIIEPSIPQAAPSLELEAEKSKPTLTPEQIEVASWLNRRPTTAWSAKELKAWKQIPKPIDSEDWQALKWYYTRSGCKYLRKDIFTLLNNWSGEIDRAKNYDPNEK